MFFFSLGEQDEPLYRVLKPYPYPGIHRYHRYNAPKTAVLVHLNDITILCLIVNP